MTGFDSTWYHGPFAAGFAQSGDTWRSSSSRRSSSPGSTRRTRSWCTASACSPLTATCSRRCSTSPGWGAACSPPGASAGPTASAPLSLARGCVALATPAPGRSGRRGAQRHRRHLLPARRGRDRRQRARAPNASPTGRQRTASAGALILAGLAAGLAAGTKLNFLAPAARPGRRAGADRAARASAGGRWPRRAPALAGGGYWYLRNLVHAGNPLPWVKHLGPLTCRRPTRRGGREGHSVLHYLTDGWVWSDWFLPGPARGPRPALAGAAGAARWPGSVCLRRGAEPGAARRRRWSAGAALAWLVAPTSASGPEACRAGFVSGLRYLAPALALGLALLPLASVPSAARERAARIASVFPVRADIQSAEL